MLTSIVSLLICLSQLADGDQYLSSQVDCRTACEPNNVSCITRCLLAKTLNKKDNFHQRNRRSPQNDVTGNLGWSNSGVTILGAGETPPPGLIFPTDGIPPIFPDARQHACRGANPKDDSVVYPGKVHNVQMECEPATSFTPQKVVVKWSLPEKFMTHLVEGYEITYHVKTDNVIDTSVNCLYASNTSRSLSFPMTIGSDEHLYVAVIALPTYKDLSTAMSVASCLENETESSNSVNTKRDDNDGKSPLNLALVVGCTAGALCFVLVLAFVAKLLTTKLGRHSCWGNDDVHDKDIDLGVEETEYQRQFTQETIVRTGSMLSFTSADSVQLAMEKSKPDANDATPSDNENPLPKVYISYYPESEDFMASLLSLVARLRSRHSIDIIIDELDKRSIDKLGIAGWCNINLKRCDKLMMALTPKYLDALSVIHQDHAQSSLDANCLRKICLEERYITSRLFAENQHSSCLVLLLAGTKESQLPASLSGRAVYEWPKAKTESERSLVCCLSGIEDFIVN